MQAHRDAAAGMLGRVLFLFPSGRRGPFGLFVTANRSLLINRALLVERTAPMGIHGEAEDGGFSPTDICHLLEPIRTAWIRT